jgi:hypothetical protein
MRFAAVIALLFACAEAFDVIQLTPDNYDEMTDGKTVFLKFFAPWVRRLIDRPTDLPVGRPV